MNFSTVLQFVAVAVLAVATAATSPPGWSPEFKPHYETSVYSYGLVRKLHHSPLQRALVNSPRADLCAPLI